MIFIDKNKPLTRRFDVEEHEMINDMLITDLDKKENKSEHILNAIAEERMELQKMEAKEKRRKNGKKNVA